MPLLSAIEVWFGLLGSGVATLFTAILAGRSQSIWKVTSLIVLELVLFGAALVSWFFVVWFVAKTLMTIGLAASSALLFGIVIGIAALALAILACLRLVQAGYTVFGAKTRFTSDFGNSLWFGRVGPFRPKDFQQ